MDAWFATAHPAHEAPEQVVYPISPPKAAPKAAPATKTRQPLYAPKNPVATKARKQLHAPKNVAPGAKAAAPTTSARQPLHMSKRPTAAAKTPRAASDKTTASGGTASSRRVQQVRSFSVIVTSDDTVRSSLFRPSTTQASSENSYSASNVREVKHCAMPEVSPAPRPATPRHAACQLCILCLHTDTALLTLVTARHQHHCHQHRQRHQQQQQQHHHHHQHQHQHQCAFAHITAGSEQASHSQAGGPAWQQGHGDGGPAGHCGRAQPQGGRAAEAEAHARSAGKPEGPQRAEGGGGGGGSGGGGVSVGGGGRCGGG
jgi:hypothetical protein